MSAGLEVEVGTVPTGSTIITGGHRPCPCWTSCLAKATSPAGLHKGHAGAALQCGLFQPAAAHYASLLRQGPGNGV